MTDGSGVYCHACHHQWERRRGDVDIKCPNCQNNATTEIITPEDDPRQFHNPQPQATMGSPDAAPTGTPSVEAHPAAPETHEDQERREAPANNEQSTGSSPNGHNTPSNSGSGPQPQYFFFFPPVTFITATIVTPNHPQAPTSPAPHSAGPTDNSTPALSPSPTPAPADRPSTESRSPSFNFFPFNLFAPQRTSPQESPSAPPPTGANSPPSGTETPVAPPPATAPETPHPDNAHHSVDTNGAPNHMPVPPFANMGGSFAPFIQVTFPQGAPQQSGGQPQVFTPHVLALLRFLSTMPGMGGDASYSEQDFERILGRLWEQSQPQGAPPASQAALDALEVKEVDDKMLGDDGDARCVVCVDDLTKGEKVTSLPCGHFFHGDCVVPWLKVHNTCPTCRNPVESSQAKAGKAAQFDMPQRATMDEQHRQEGWHEGAFH